MNRDPELLTPNERRAAICQLLATGFRRFEISQPDAEKRLDETPASMAHGHRGEHMETKNE